MVARQRRTGFSSLLHSTEIVHLQRSSILQDNLDADYTATHWKLLLTTILEETRTKVIGLLVPGG